MAKHIDISVAMVREQILLGNILVVYCPTADNIADVFTKPLARPQFRKFRVLILGCDLKPVALISLGGDNLSA